MTRRHGAHTASPGPGPPERSLSIGAQQWTIVTAGAIAAGAGLRIWILASPLGGLDADEGVSGLMAKQIVHGSLPTFYWGQSYGGTLEAFLTAPLIAIAGTSTTVVRLVPIGLFIGAGFLLWRVGRRTVGEPAARIGVALYAIWPAYLAWKSTRAHGFYGASAVLTLLVLLLALRVRERPSRRDLAALGLVLGTSWWTSPQFVFVAVPALAWLLATRPSILRSAWLAAPGILLGAAPWLAWNVRHGWASLMAPFADTGTYSDHLRTFFYATLPQALGLRVPFTLEWVVGEVPGRALELAAVAGLVWQVFRVRDDRLLLLVVAIAYPFTQSISPFSTLTDEPRYLVLLAPVLALLIAQLFVRPPSALALVVGLVLTIVAVRAMAGVEPPVPPVGGIRTPASIAPVIEVLDGNHVDRVCAQYAIAYRLTFETDERIVAASTSQVRYRPYQAKVARSRRVAWVFVAGSEEERARRGALRALGYSRVRTSDWAVWLARRARSAKCARAA